MGYYSSMTGSITVIPVPPVSLWKPAPLEGDRYFQGGLECLNVTFECESSFIIEEDGTEVTRTKPIGLEIRSCENSDHKHYYIVETLQEIVNMLGPEREYQGYFEFRGEDATIWRVAVVAGVAQEIKPQITWPEVV